MKTRLWNAYFASVIVKKTTKNLSYSRHPENKQTNTKIPNEAISFVGNLKLTN